MKIKHLTILLLLISSLSSHAQLEFGVKTGLNYSIVTGGNPTTDNRNYMPQHHVGVTTSYKAGEFSRFILELMLQNKGYSYTRHDYSQNIRFFKRNTYLSINLNLAYEVLDKFDLIFGMEVSRYLDTSVSELFAIDSPHISYDRDYKPWDVGAIIGMKYMFLKYFNVEVRYIHGLLDVKPNPSLKEFNRVFQISLAYQF